MKKRYSIPSLTVVTMDCTDIVTNSPNDVTYGGKSVKGSAEAPQRRGGIWDEE